jgi:GNAT acetyltransferase-like protein
VPVTTLEVSWPHRTDRLVLRQVREEDIDRLLEFRNKPEVYRWLLKTVVDAEKFRAAWMKTLTDPRDHSSVIELDGVVIGTASLDVRDAMGQDEAEEMVGARPRSGTRSTRRTPAAATPPRPRPRCCGSVSRTSASAG